jgi:hypothetical protein
LLGEAAGEAEDAALKPELLKPRCADAGGAALGAPQPPPPSAVAVDEERGLCMPKSGDEGDEAAESGEGEAAKGLA